MPRKRCQHEPGEGTLYTTLGLTASLNRQDDYPVEAVCAKCSRPIVLPQPGEAPRLKYLDDRIADFRARHPEVTIGENDQSASWFDDDGPQAVSYGSADRLIDYLEARFDR